LIALPYQKGSKSIFKEISKFPSVRRDLALLLDKKIENGNLTFILLSNIGQSFVKNNIAISDFNKIMTSFLN
jgi:phenylalanyl-tRNA synthetase beta subunit